ncbi:Ankyrin repeat family protein [Arabidopsis thaliana]|jgi:ankyrin repeat protein|uniref:Ankyrin repeat family protein n=1 Tax=Arabidopsis thaliana TaxID=3702 RepID=F4JG84_ARATH|nr:Ankyrin repeat family protein [Arabidopsis thaliana]AEE82324.2 Ankyrin repeat family protein [Arabidopsis thaliana]|eukprot:NP_001319860.1 Ankyrin repeat family protein [Arabidopsis thaliana]
MGRSDLDFDRQKKDASSRMFYADETGRTHSLDLSTLFNDTSETVPMGPKTIAAVRAGDETYLRDMKFDVNIALSSVNDHGNTMLHLAAAAGHTDLVCYILNAYPGLLMKSNSMGEVALHVAAGAGHLAVVEALVSFIKDISCNKPGVAKKIYFAKDRHQDNALHVSLKRKHLKVASCLVCAEQSLSFVANNDGVSPLYLAVEAGQADLAKTMWQHSNNGSSSTSTLASKIGGRSIVHGAMKARRKDILVAILSEDASLINFRDEGRTCLSFGASLGYYEGFCYLLDKALDSVYVSDDDGSFPIHMAVKYGYVKILKAILKRCPDALELLDRENQNVLHVAAKNGKIEVLKFILRCCKDKNKEKLINEEDANGNTPLHLATKNWHPKVVSMLTWDNRVDLKTLNHDGVTALDIAEKNMDSSYTFFERLTWMALISAGAPRGPKLILSTPVTQNSDGGKYKDRVNTLLLVATLVATMTFTAGFTLPGGYNGSVPNFGMATLAKKTAFQVFLVFDTLAMYCSIITIVALIWAQLGDLSLIMKAFNLALPLLGLALTSMSIAFMAGTYAAVSHLPLLAYFILGIGLIFLLVLLLIIIPYVSPHSPTQPFLRHIFYYPYFLMLLVAGDNRNKY